MAVKMMQTLYKLTPLFFADLSYAVALRSMILLQFGTYWLGILDIAALLVSIIWAIIAVLSSCV